MKLIILHDPICQTKVGGKPQFVGENMKVQNPQTKTKTCIRSFVALVLMLQRRFLLAFGTTRFREMSEKKTHMFRKLSGNVPDMFHGYVPEKNPET